MQTNSEHASNVAVGNSVRSISHIVGCRCYMIMFDALMNTSQDRRQSLLSVKLRSGVGNSNSQAASAAPSGRTSTHLAGSDTMRWQSKNASSLCFLRLATTGGPIVRFLTKCPSWTAHGIQRQVHVHGADCIIACILDVCFVKTSVEVALTIRESSLSLEHVEVVSLDR